MANTLEGFDGRRAARLLGPLLLIVSVGCGGEEPTAMDEPCGGNGTIHGEGAGAHCHCNAGFVEEGDTCVLASTQPDPDPDPDPGPGPTPIAPDCGPNGVFTGRACDCDAGYTQIGLAEQRTCAAIPACQGADDGMEPNDVPREASLLSQVSGTLYACPADADWYVFEVTSGDRVSVEIRFDGQSVDLDLLVYGPSSQNPVAFSLESTGNVESARFIARASGTAGIYVAPYGIGEGTYEMQVDVRAGDPPMCGGPGAFCSGASDCCSGNCHVGHCH